MRRDFSFFLLMTLVVTWSAATAAAATHSFAQTRYEAFTQPIQQIEVAASESGRIATVSIQRGSVVAKDQLLMQLDTRVLEASRIVAQVRSESTARVDALRVDLEIKQDRYEKIRRLQADGAGSAEESKRAKADAEIAMLDVKAAADNLRLAQLEVDEIQARIEQRQVRSPIAGVVTEVRKEPGEYVSLSEPQVATIVRLDQLRATFFIPTSLAMRLSVDDRLSLQFPGAEKDSDLTEVIGVIQHIGAVTQADSGRVRMDLLIDNAAGKYRSGVRCMLVAP